MNFVFNKKKISIKNRIYPIIFIIILLIYFVNNIFFLKNTLRINMILNSIFNIESININYLIKNKIRILYIMRDIIDSFRLNYEINIENNNLKKEILRLQSENNEIIDLLNHKRLIKDIFDKNYDLLATNIVFENKNEFIVKFTDNSIKENNIIFNKYGFIGKIYKIFTIGENKIAFCYKINNKDFNIPIIIDDKYLGILRTNNEIVYDIKFDINDIKINSNIYLMSQENIIPKNILIGRVKYINNKDIKIQFNQEIYNLLNLKSSMVFILYKI